MQVTIYKATYNKAHNTGYSDEVNNTRKRDIHYKENLPQQTIHYNQ